MANVTTPKNLKMVVIGGGTGSFMVLSALKQYTNSITALVNMADDGGSTGVLRDELGTLPPGDVRKCLVALSDSPKVRNLFDYRFEEGTFEGHAFGNLLLSALEKITGSFSDAIDTASEILRIRGRVVPVTFDNVRLKMEWGDASKILHGERIIDADHFSHDPRNATLSLVPEAHANPEAIEAIKNADLVIIAPGDLYTSLGPLLIIDGIGGALETTTAPVVYAANLVTKKGQTGGFTVCDHADEVERLAGRPILDYVLYNNQRPDKELAERYRQEDAYLVEIDSMKLKKKRYRGIAGEFLGAMATPSTYVEASQVTRSLIRHDSAALAAAIMDIYSNTRPKS